ncbi:MAG: hypothetical protein E7169_00330 [Firmicutes bacterium]|nr:hypothetical protein [Bacillota bacterium]
MNKHEEFKVEINYIKDENYKNNIKILLDLLPDYFYEVAASSTGKYHPKYTLGLGGLVRHTKAAVKVAYDLLNNQIIGSKFAPREKDLMIMSLLVHDGLKHGITKSTYAVFDHPLIMASFIRENKNKLTLSNDDIEFMASVIETHMGEWNTNPYSNVILPLPNNKYQKFVHMCDFLASRKFVNINFENNNIVE